ncbi:MAG: FGGY-family carbohydrate kinase [Hormoscilla sp. SP12CHS1]|nr:FGGY-family carbohydrate kinase [Hormoscilla sp. SP12CHS1]
MNFYIGIDFGTSGARAVVIDVAGIVQAEAQYDFAQKTIIQPENLTNNWQNTLFYLIEQIPIDVRRTVKAIAINGTSSTVLLCDADGLPVEDPILYNDARGVVMMEKMKAIAPPNHTVISATSSLAKLLSLMEHVQYPTQNYYFLHQADWLAFHLHGKLGISDYHNALKLGYDVETLSYPAWLENRELEFNRNPHPKEWGYTNKARLRGLNMGQDSRKWDGTTVYLPQVLAPGCPIGQLKPEIASSLSLPRDCIVCAGTTDSIAAFIASGARTPGEAVTSLGSTLVLKLLSTTPVNNAQSGIYSHRLGNLWLVGGASNTGGAVLRQFFTDGELEYLSQKIDPALASPLDYYPLPQTGDRFPINDPNLPLAIEPRPDNPVEFLHGLLESMAKIEARGYQLLQQLGATVLSRVYTAGGGAKNPTWTAIRGRHLQVPMMTPVNTAAAYGTALLALRARAAFF